MSAPVVVDAPTSDLEAAERRLYEAEICLHIAHQSGVDAWIRAAGDRLHEALAS